VIDQTRVCEGLLFATRRDRCLYIGLWSWQKPQWLKDHPDKWRRLEDVEQAVAQLSSPVEPAITEAGSAEPNGQTSFHDVHTPADGSSPPSQPESMPATVNESVPSGPTHELPRSAVAAITETNESETDTTPLEETERKQNRAGRQRKKRKLSAKVLKARRKRMLVHQI
jgi:hypothetical protein